MRRCSNCAIFVQQGKCPFSTKARRAEDAGAQLLIVATAADGPTISMTSEVHRTWYGAKTPRITAISVSKAVGRQAVLAMNGNGQLAASCWKRQANVYGDIMSEAAVAILAVSLVMLGAWHSVEDLRKPDNQDKFNEQCLAVEETSGLQFVFFGSAMLTILFFLHEVLNLHFITDVRERRSVNHGHALGATRSSLATFLASSKGLQGACKNSRTAWRGAGAYLVRCHC